METKIAYLSEVKTSAALLEVLMQIDMGNLHLSTQYFIDVADTATSRIAACTASGTEVTRALSWTLTAARFALKVIHYLKTWNTDYVILHTYKERKALVIPRACAWTMALAMAYKRSDKGIQIETSESGGKAIFHFKDGDGFLIATIG